MEERISVCITRLQEVEKLLADPNVFGDPKEYEKLTKEHAYLSSIKNVVDEICRLKKIAQDDRDALQLEKDQEMIELLEGGLLSIEAQLAALSSKLESLLVPPDPDDDLNVIMELRAGTGGDEAALFVGDCVRMYLLYASSRGWKTEPLSVSESSIGGYKEYVMGVSGSGVKRLLQYEAGTHRVQRVPATETQGRVHTSAITVAVLLEPAEAEVVIDEKDLKIDTFRASGAGGQHVNVTDSAVRITHIPTGTVVTCQDERSQHKNKDKAMRILNAKVREAEAKKRMEAESALRLSQVGSGDRSERIRTYNFPQNRITDHRINLTLYNLDKVMEGDLDCITEALVRFFYQKRLES
ncbi:peptide chain release factor 1 [Chlamydiifrater phoenicopteri]|uniref:peptide chain release factor 1 n=1 Tax=Chlamydiifrater phoenicopteri TaxID=2681469 RepID=UPI001BCD20AA|nr:peptide chain release factor 1 [Chlamydiifrater phoenicopteri]